jgi:hypothetical protein
MASVFVVDSTLEGALAALAYVYPHRHGGPPYPLPVLYNTWNTRGKQTTLAQGLSSLIPIPIVSVTPTTLQPLTSIDNHNNNNNNNSTIPNHLLVEIGVVQLAA